MQSFGSLVADRAPFLAAVYCVLAMQLGVTAAVIAYLRGHKYAPTLWNVAPLAVASLGAVLVMTLVPMHPALKLAVFTAFSVMIGALSIAASDRVPIEAVQSAAMSAVGIFLGMTLLAFALAAAGVDLGFMGFALLSALLGLIVAMLVCAFVYPKSGAVRRALFAFGAALFSVYIAYDTNAMLMRAGEQDVVTAALGLFLDVFNLFQDLLGMGAR